MRKLCIAILVFAAVAFAGVNFDIIRKAADNEKANQSVSYPYDAINDVAQYVQPAALVTERIHAGTVVCEEGVCYATFDKTVFGTLEIHFPEPLPSDRSFKITLSEALNDRGRPWTRADVRNSRVGLGITFYDAEVDVPEGTRIYRVVLPERPLPLRASIKSEDWQGGLLPFCCCSIKGESSETLTVENLFQLAVHSEFDDDASAFESDDALLNEIYGFCKDTVKYTTYAGVYVDGFRELKPYEADAYIHQMGHFSVDNHYEIARRTIEYLIHHHSWPTEWILQTIPLVYEYYMYTGDVDFIARIYPELDGCLLRTILNDDGLPDIRLADPEVYSAFQLPEIRDIVDWPEGQRDDFASERVLGWDQFISGLDAGYKAAVSRMAGLYYTSTMYAVTSAAALNGSAVVASPNAVVSAFYYRALRLMAALAAAVDNRIDATRYDHEADDFAELYRGSFIDPETGLVKDAKDSDHHSLHGNMFALDFGLIPPGGEGRVVAFIKEKGMACSVYGAQYLLEALIKYGEEDYALSLLTSRGENSWYNMIYRTGSKLATEAWDERVKPDMDWNHAWATSPVNILTRYILGIRPFAPGFSTVTLEPRFGRIRNCRATIPLGDGSISLEYSCGDDERATLKVDSTVPIRFVRPAQAGDLRVDGKANGAEQCILTSGEHLIEYRAG